MTGEHPPTPEQQAPDLRPFGYAPGNYMCICRTCHSEFIGDKRAMNCKECAEQRMSELDDHERELEDPKARIGSPSTERSLPSNPHAKWLREAAKRLAGENRTSLAHTCDQAANEIDAIERDRTKFAERLADCEISLGAFDPSAVSEYWLKYAPGAMHTAKPPSPDETSGDYAKVYDVFKIGSAMRTPAVLRANVENARRRSDCLSAIEREFFTYVVADEDGEDMERCDLSWGADPAEYVEQFRAALSKRASPEKAPAVHTYTCTECFTDAGQLHKPGCRYIEIDARRAQNGNGDI